ncbi:hypothetical protein NVP1023O_73 [Vibrio phage 1.023.O._10N.222.51.B4]|nr:hypothetical protein NVP1023O_73 [Vibrio phage 1.023.O._10N.222.51.B4]
MSKSVWKFPLKVADEQYIDVPVGAEPLKAEMQNGELCLWMLVQPSSNKVTKKVHVHGTGHNVDDALTLGDYVDSFMMHDGALVFHVFVTENR